MDETGFARSSQRLHDRAKTGQRVGGLQQANKRPRTSLIGAYCNNELIAPMLFEGSCNSAVFNIWLEQQLLPQLLCGSVIVMDNAAFHKSAQTQQLIEQAACELLFLPVYSPDLNPIEKLWANLKRQRQYKDCSLEELILESGYFGD